MSILNRHDLALISIDFGSAFTKVGFRKKTSKPSIERDSGSAFAKKGVHLQELGESVNLRDLNLSFDPDSICIPTIIARVETQNGVQWYGGHEAENFREGEGIKKYKDWKRDIFEQGAFIVNVDNGTNLWTPATDGIEGFLEDLAAIGETPRIIASIASALCLAPCALCLAPCALCLVPCALCLEEKVVSDLAAKHSLSISQLREAARRLGLSGESLSFQMNMGGEALVVDTLRSTLADFEHAIQYFAWLLTYVESYAIEKGLPSPRETHARICIPEFIDSGRIGALHGSNLIQSILEKAGWLLDSDIPVVGEPMANAIGLMTEGKNWVGWALYSNSEVSLRWDYMFQNNSLKSAFTNSIETHVILVVDVGAFTSDFAVLSFDTGDCDKYPSCYSRSVRLGISQMEDEILASLPSDKRAVVNSLTLEGREEFRKDVYSQNKIFDIRAGGDGPTRFTIGEDQERRMINEKIEWFAERVSEEVVVFMNHEQIECVDQIMFTGGGCQIGRLVEIVRKKLSDSYPRKNNREQVCHSPQPSDFKNDPSRHGIEGRLVRGATSIGGSSAYFNFSMPPR